MEVRQTAADGIFVDVSYYDLVADPLGELRRVYRAAGVDFSERVERAAKAVSGRNVKGRHGRHVYSLADFGLDGATVERYCANYRREYRIPVEESGP